VKRKWRQFFVIDMMTALWKNTGSGNTQTHQFHLPIFGWMWACGLTHDPLWWLEQNTLLLPTMGISHQISFLLHHMTESLQSAVWFYYTSVTKHSCEMADRNTDRSLESYGHSQGENPEWSRRRDLLLPPAMSSETRLHASATAGNTERWQYNNTHSNYMNDRCGRNSA